MKIIGSAAGSTSRVSSSAGPLARRKTALVMVAVAATTLMASGGLAAAEATPLPGVTDAGQPIAVRESEPPAAAGRNDTPATAQVLSGLGTAAGGAGQAAISGTLAAPAEPVVLPMGREDNGTTETAVDIEDRGGKVVRTTGTIGDGPHGAAGDKSGDFDFYVIHNTTHGQVLSVHVDTPDSTLHPTVRYWAEGVSDGMASSDRASTLLTKQIESDGDAYISIGGEGSEQANPSDSGSGNGAKSEGAYTATFALDAGDTDVYAVDLVSGDVLSGAVSGGAARLQLFDSTNTLAISSMETRSDSWLPTTSPVARGGNAAINHIAARAGRYYFAVSGGQGRYDATVKVNRPGPERKQATQTIFIDVDGADVDPAIFPSSNATGVRTLSPLSAFTSSWGLTTKAQQDALIGQIVNTVTENLQGDFASTGSKVRILNSRDDKDPFGQPNVSRIVIGGTQQELGASGLGISQFIDPGNFSTEDTAVVLLDVMAATGSAANEYSLTRYLKPTSDRVKFVGTAIGNVASHEAGHYLGLYHAGGLTGEKISLMMPGQVYYLAYGVGPDNIGGTADDVDIDYAAAAYGFETGFTGTEDCRTRIRWALS